MIDRKTALMAAGVILIASAAFSYGASAKDEPQPLQPSSNWNLNYAEKNCRLMRTFGEGDDKVVFAIEQALPGDHFSVIVAGRPLRSLYLKPTPEDVQIQFGPFEEVSDVTAVEGDLGEFKPAAIISVAKLGTLPSEAEDRPEGYSAPGPFDVVGRTFPEGRAEQIEWFRIERRRKPVTLATGPMAKPVAALQKCMEDLVSTWGIDVAAHRKLSRRVEPTNDPGNWIRSTDYPVSELWKGGQAIIKFRLTVNEEGLPVDCDVSGLTDSAEFAEISCARLRKRARFTPALDADGKPITSVYLGTVRFQMP